MSDTYDVTRVGTQAEWIALKAPWMELVASNPTISLFLTWEWINTWWQHYHQEGELWVLVARDRKSGRVAGIAPWMLRERSVGPLSLRTIAFIFYRPPIHLDILSAPDEQAGVYRAFAKHLTAHAEKWDLLDLNGFASGATLKPALRSVGIRFREREAPLYHVISLPEDWDTYQMKHLSANRRQQVKNYRRRLERAYPGEVTYEQVSDADQLQRSLATLIGQNRDRWHEQGLRSAFDDQRFASFHQEMAKLALERGWLRFYQLKVGDDIATTRYGFLYQSVFYDYQMSFAEEWANYRTGELLLMHAVQEAIQEGAHLFDMLRGTYRWKRSWATHTFYESHLLASGNRRGTVWLHGTELVDAAQDKSRELFSEATRQRINRVLSLRHRLRSPRSGSQAK